MNSFPTIFFLNLTETRYNRYVAKTGRTLQYYLESFEVSDIEHDFCELTSLGLRLNGNRMVLV
jgi:hypothetical protein